MRLLTTVLLGASMIVAAPAHAQEASVVAPAPWGYAPYPYAPYAAAPYGWQPPPAVTERRSNGMRITGITLFVLGGVAHAIGAGILAVGLTTSCPVFDETDGLPPSHRVRVRAREPVGIARQALGECGGDTVSVGASVMAAGFLATIGGIPLLVFGNERVRVRPEGAAAPAPELHVGLGGADLRWLF